MGKSAVIADVIDRLRDDGTLHLAFRVDQAGAIATLDELGAQTVGTADNPVVILEQLAAGKRAVLIVDQADAVSEVSGRTRSEEHTTELQSLMRISYAVFCLQ